MEQRMTGTFYGVSVGPGDPELLTLQAVRLLRQCPVLAAPQTASGQMLALDIARRALGSELDGKTILSAIKCKHRVMLPHLRFKSFYHIGSDIRRI